MELESYFEDLTGRDWQVSTEGTVRFAMVGLGWWTREFAVPVTEESDMCTTTTVVSSSTEKAQAFADDFEAVEHALTYDEFHDGAAADAYDAVYVATPNALHLEYVETAADLGKDVLCEKPMEASVERSEAMVDAANDVTLMIAYRMHTDPAVRRMRALVRDGFLGEPMQVHGHMSQRLLEIFESMDQWRLNPDLAGRGTSVTDLGVYPLNTTRFILERDPISVSADMWSGSAGFEDVPDERAAFTVRFEDDVIASCSASQNGFKHGFLRITGTEGELLLEPAFLRPSGLTIAKGEVRSSFDLPDVGEYYQMREEFDYFADCLLSDREPLADGEHGLVDMRTIDAAYDAAETGDRVHVEE